MRFGRGVIHFSMASYDVVAQEAVDHHIEVWESHAMSHWTCSCGRGGTGPSTSTLPRALAAAQRHALPKERTSINALVD